MDCPEWEGGRLTEINANFFIVFKDEQLPIALWLAGK
jgi:hypothetical protein